MSDEDKKVIFCGVLTVSDRCSSGTREDLSGPNLQKLLHDYSGIKAIVKVRKVVPDELDDIKNTLIEWCDKEGISLVITSGGTGLAPTDVTPDATAQVIDKEVNGIVTGLVAASLRATRFSMLTRMKCGIRGTSLIINLPGSKKASEECLRFLLPILDHAVDLIKCNLDEVELVHRECDAGGHNYRLLESDRGNHAPVVGSEEINQHELRPPPLAHVTGYAHSHGITNHAFHGLTQHHIMDGHHAAHHVGHHAAHHVAHHAQHHSMDGAHHGHHQATEMLTMTETELELDTMDLERELQLTTELEPSDTISSGPGSKIAIVLSSEKRKSEPEYVIPMKVARRERSSPYPLVPVDKAFAMVLENTSVLPVKTLTYADALGHIVGKDIKSPDSVPQFPASIKDGYAVLAEDTPGDLTVVGATVCGSPMVGRPLKKGQAIRITTGAPIPPGADSIVQVEDTKLLEEADQGKKEVKISVLAKVIKGQDIRKEGSDIKKGDVVLSSGALLGPSEIGILASIGVTEVPVYGKPTVAVMSTGNEVTEPAAGSPSMGQIRDSNRIMLLSALKLAGYQTFDMGIVPDEPDKLKLSLKEAMAKADVVVSSGGVSMGEKDFLKIVIQNIGGNIHFGRVLMKPGKPTTFATIKTDTGKKLFFALPGNPVSAIVTFNVFALPALKKMSGFRNTRDTVIKARISSAVKLDPRPEYHRCTVYWKPGDHTPWASSTGSQMSSKLTSMREANALLLLPPKTDNCSEIGTGELVDIMLLEKL